MHSHATTATYDDNAQQGAGKGAMVLGAAGEGMLASILREKATATERAQAQERRRVVRALRRAFRRADADCSGTLDISEASLTTNYYLLCYTVTVRLQC
jgi:hypothetical protein